MIEGHGDDAYRYKGIKMDFSSNICVHRNHQSLMAHLLSCPELLAHYPEPEAWSLEKMIAMRHGIPAQCVIVTSGATDAIYLVAQAFRLKHFTPPTSFSEYDDAIRMFPTEDPTRSVGWICNPNNPTGTTTHLNVVYEIAQNYDLTVIDQSYEHYTTEPIMSAKAAVCHDNIIQIHSMTKTYGVPGLRLGYIVANCKLTTQLRQHLRPWNVSALAIEAGKFLLQHDELICKPDLDEAKRLFQALSSIDGISVGYSQTNFCLCTIQFHTATELKEYLIRKYGILIRDASNFKGLTPHHFRVASQTPKENDTLVTAIQQFVNARKHQRP